MPGVSLRTTEGGTAELLALAAGEPAVVLVAYEKQAQFDLDRWLVGLQQVQLPAELFQVAVGRGLRTSRESGWLDEATRAALPDQSWSFLRAEGSGKQALRRATGDAEGQNVRVLVLDGEGQVQWFSDVGYSASRARRVAEMVDSLRREAQLPVAEQRPRARAATLSADDLTVQQAAEAGADDPLVGRAFPEVEGKVRWYDSGGYAPEKARAVAEALRSGD